MISAKEAIQKLKEGNAAYVSADTFQSDISSRVLEHFARNGQEPYAIVICCSDSRVIPERIFHAAIGDLFKQMMLEELLGERKPNNQAHDCN